MAVEDGSLCCLTFNDGACHVSPGFVSICVSKAQQVTVTLSSYNTAEGSKPMEKMQKNDSCDFYKLVSLLDQNHLSKLQSTIMYASILYMSKRTFFLYSNHFRHCRVRDDQEREEVECSRACRQPFNKDFKSGRAKSSPAFIR